MTKLDGSSRALTKPAQHSVRRLAEISTQADVADIVEIAHQKYLIRAGLLAGVYVARAFPKAPSKSRGLIAEAVGDTEQGAIDALLATINARDVQRVGERRWEPDLEFWVPNEAEFSEALNQTLLTRTQEAMLKALAWTRADGLSYAQLASEAGYKNAQTAEKIFAKVGEAIMDFLSIDLTDSPYSSSYGAGIILSTPRAQGDDLPDLWVMHPELMAAIRSAR